MASSSNTLTLNALVKKYNCLSQVKQNKHKLLGREKEVQLLHETLYKTRMKNSILVGKAGIGKTAIIQELSKQISNKYAIVEMNISQSLANTKYRGDFEDRINRIIKDIISFNSNNNDKQIIIFIDEIHTLYYTSNADNGTVGIHDMLKPYLARGDIIIIGATTDYEYKHTIKQDLALMRRLTPIYIEELSEEYIIKILRDFSNKKVSQDLLKYIYEKSIEIEGYANPDISIEILDRCMARKECRGIEIDENMINDIVSWLGGKEK